MKPISDIFSIQKSMYQYMKKKALSYEGNIPDELKQYRQDQKSHILQDFIISNFSELLTSIGKSKIVYLGDFHTFDQNTKNMERLLRTLTARKKKLALGVEFIHKRHQNIIEQYLDGYITEMEFLEDIDYQQSWRFPWVHYRIFFDMAKKNNIPILALNSAGTLEKRDFRAAKIIVDYLEKHPKTTLLTLFGELHIMPDKLPQKVDRLAKTPIPSTIIHQNLDEIFFKLQQSELEKKNINQIIKFNHSEFSLQTSPPWIKYESMIYWYENLYDDPEFDIHEYAIESGHKAFNDNINENFLYISREILKSIGRKIPENELENFNLYGHLKMEFILQKLNKIPKKSVSNLYKKMLKNGKAFKIPFRNDYYCPSYSINRLSFLAGMHIYNLMLSSKKNNIENAIYDKDRVLKFLFFFYQYMISYFSSKLVNPYRKCDRYQDLIRRYRSPATRKAKKGNLKIVIEIIDRQKKLSEIIKHKSLRALQSSAKTLGSYMADSFHDGFYKTSSPETKKLLDMVMDLERTEQKFNTLLNTILPYNQYKNQKKRFF